MSTPAALRKGIEEAVRLLRGEGVVAFPTDTLYGLGADAFSCNAVHRVFDIKGRPSEMALPLLLGSIEDLKVVATDISKAAWALVDRFWPGALTLVLQKSPRVSYLVTGGRDSVAVRMPNHQVPLSLVRELGRPITGTSANISGGPDPNTPGDVRRSLGEKVDYVVDGGPVAGGISSTIVDLTGAGPILLRPGAISHESLQAVCSMSLKSA